MIELNELFKIYSTKAGDVYVLRDINLTVEKGEFLTIMGPSGAGKSTLLHILGLLDSPSRGTYTLLENDVSRLKEKQRTEYHRNHIGFVFQSYHLIDELTVFENLEAPLLYGKYKRSERKAMVSDMLDRFNIVGKKDLFPNQLSGGQQQLVAVARALITSPELILADEPTGNLNSAQGKDIMELFQQLNEEDKVTIIQVTHNENNAMYGERIIHLLDGRIEKIEDTRDLLVQE